MSLCKLNYTQFPIIFIRIPKKAENREHSNSYCPTLIQGRYKFIGTIRMFAILIMMFVTIDCDWPEVGLRHRFYSLSDLKIQCSNFLFSDCLTSDPGCASKICTPLPAADLYSDT